MRPNALAREPAVSKMSYNPPPPGMAFPPTRKSHKGLYAAITIAIIIVIAVVIVGTSPNVSFSIFGPTQTPSVPYAPADLQVWNIEIIGEPRQYAAVQYNVYVVNSGNVKSGSYDLNIDILDTTHSDHYFKGPFRLGPVETLHSTNEAVLVYQGTFYPNEEGVYEIHALITPVDFTESDEGNNAFTSQGFTVSPA